MRKLRDVFYINANIEKQYTIFYGMEFKEFIKCNPTKIDNILITDGKFIGNNFNYNWWLETVNGDGFSELCKEDLYGLGNFHWIDYKNEIDLDNCTPEEKAEVLYLSHFGEPLKTPFIDRINNNFFYLAHDDGWFCKLYCRDISAIREVISNKIIESVTTNKKRKIYPIDNEVKNKLFELVQKGLLIDFSNIYRDDKAININFYVIGEYHNMDEMYNNLERNKSRASTRGRIEHKNKAWKVYFYNK
ncbi:hypothetical protein [Candidatus Clostridium radicumherbarum]|uniref:Uncharacterized protein n=1 Tax=Candidatus Clostridium radicumherbarum TaxID=3381662 RepID=A0ABW8TRM3_9CLOT